MPLNVITGRSGSGKTTHMLKEIIERIETNRDENIILIVPEQMTFQAEYAVTKRVRTRTVANLQVLSFKRLAYRVFLEVGGASKQYIGDQTILMMLTKILLEKRPEFKVYHRMEPNYSFVSMVYDLIKEFKSYAYTPDTLRMILEREVDEQLKHKVHDLWLVFQELLRLYGDTIRDTEDFYQELSQRILNSSYIQDSIVYVDGYHHLTGVEMNVLLSLIKRAKEVNWLLTIDRLDKRHGYVQPDHLFHPVYRMASKLFERCHDEGIDVRIVHHFPEPLRFQNAELTFLEQTYDVPSAIFREDVTHLRIFECMRPESEVHLVARTIYQALLEGASYHDFAIYTNNQEVYYPLIKNIFKRYDLPVFIDDGEKMLDHSLLNFIDAVLEIVKTNYRHDAMFRAIKTELFMPLMVDGEPVTVMNYPRFIQSYREDLDQLEIYCLSHGINHTDWLNQPFTIDINRRLSDREKAKTDRERALEEKFQRLQEAIITPLKGFVERFTASPYVRDKVQALFELLRQLDVEEKLSLYEQLDTIRSESLLDLERAKKHKQVYNKLIELFDELVLVCGDYEVNTDTFIQLLRNGFRGMVFQLVPPALEQILVGDLKRSRFELISRTDGCLGIKTAFILGVNEGQFPRVYQEKGLLTNKEREQLLALGFDCDLTVEQAFLDEQFYIYKAFSSASHELILTYSLSDQEKKESFRSFVIDDLLKKFPALEVQTVYDFPEPQDDPYVYITTPNVTASLLLEAIERKRKKETVHPVWSDVFHYYQQHPVLKRRLIGVEHKNVAESLTSEDIRALFGDTLTVSISSLEQYNACPYAYFLERGLGLKERDVKKVEAVDIGELYHETLKALAYTLMKEEKKLHELSMETLKRIVETQVERLAQHVQRKFFFDNERHQYLLQKIKETLLNSILAMRYHSEHTSFKVFAVEEEFGREAKRIRIPEKTIDGFRIQLKGIIDRIDYAKTDHQTLISIIDYKSGSRTVDFSKIYYRLSLQLFTYLNAVLENQNVLFPGEEVIAAGVLYFHIHNPSLSITEEYSEDDLFMERLRKYRMEGFTLQNLDVTKQFDHHLSIGQSSPIIPVTRTQSGYHRSYSKVLTEEEFQTVRQYTKTAIMDTVREILSGQIPIRPARYAQEPPLCQYCPYKAVCKFDATRPENRYRIFERFKRREDAIQKMKERIEGGGEHEVDE